MSITSLYKKTFGELLFPLGFHQHKNRFWRVTDEMYQAFSFRVSGRLTDSITFGIEPFAMGLSISCTLEADCDRESLGVFSLTQPYWLHHIPRTEEQAVAVVDSVCAVIQSRLIPFFGRTQNCDVAYEEIHALYELNRSSSWVRSRWKEPFERDVWFFGNERFYMLLKLGKLEEAQAFQLECKKKEQNSHKDWTVHPFDVKLFGEEEALARLLQKKRARLAPIDAAIELTKHPEQVRQLIAENERKSRMSFGLPPDPPDITS
jgi:hypothetical protein